MTVYEVDLPLVLSVDASTQVQSPLLSQSLMDELRRDPRINSMHGRLIRDEAPVLIYPNNVPGVAFARPPVTVFGIVPSEALISSAKWLVVTAR